MDINNKIMQRHENNRVKEKNSFHYLPNLYKMAS